MRPEKKMELPPYEAMNPEQASPSSPTPESSPQQTQEKPPLPVPETPTLSPEREVPTELQAEQQENNAKNRESQLPKRSQTSIAQPNQSQQTQNVPVQKSAVYKKIETILEEDVEEMFAHMDQATQILFEQKGEEAISKIEQLIATTKATARNLYKIIRNWLKIIPGVNKFFLEQASKLKTDKLIKLAQEEKNKRL